MGIPTPNEVIIAGLAGSVLWLIYKTVRNCYRALIRPSKGLK